MDSSVDPRFKDTVFVVEATTFEKLTLWCECADDPAARRLRIDCPGRKRYGWKQDHHGLNIYMGKVGKHEVWIDCSWEVIAGRRVLFWHPSSQVVDHKLIEKWFDKNCAPRWDFGMRRASTDAMNFHLVLDAIDELNGEPT